jgi:hypothetical protein
VPIPGRFSCTIRDRSFGPFRREGSSRFSGLDRPIHPLA